MLCFLLPHVPYHDTTTNTQTAAIKRILHLNAPITNADAQDEANHVADTAEIQWKVLVVDSEARDVISTVLRVNDLRAAGVR